jgi:succinoglycan biosynthesis protein ExoM
MAEGRAAPVEISICVCSYRRPGGLARLLRSLRTLAAGTPVHEIVVVDNDLNGSAGPVVACANAEGMSIRYSVEPIQNISIARNRAVHEAVGTLVAFIDDDEETEPGWLVNLWGELKRHRADGAVGRVIPLLPPETAGWIRDGGFFDGYSMRTGAELLWYQTRTSNALIRREALTALPVLFDPAFGLTGGEDVDLFARMIDRGHRFVAVESGVVWEDIPPERATFRWLSRRNLRNGITITRIECRGMARRRRFFYCLKALYDVLSFGVRGALRLPWSKPRGFRHLFRAVESLGRIAGLMGLSYEEYGVERKL